MVGGKIHEPRLRSTGSFSSAAVGRHQGDVVAAQNLLLYVHPRQFAVHPQLKDQYRNGRGRMPLDIVHPVLLAQRALRGEFSGADASDGAIDAKGKE